MLLLLTTAVSTTLAQGSVQLFVSQPDLSQFPTVTFNIRSSGSESIPLASLDGLSIRENGVPIGDFTLTSVPVGIDAVFVLDVNETAVIVDEGSTLNRYEKMRESILRYGIRFMSPSGLDNVSVVVPSGEENGRLLADNVTSVAQLEEALNSFQPDFSPTVPLNGMMQRALGQLEALPESNRFRAILLMTDAGRLPEQLEMSTIVERAQAADVAIFVAIVGGGISFDEVENAAALYQPTQGFYAPLPNPQDTDPIYLIWQRQANQVQVAYESFLRENGRYPITLNIGQSSASTEFELALQPPQISLTLNEDVIRRAGTAVDSPLTALEPKVQPVPVTISWPDGIERQLERVTLLLNAQPAPLLGQPLQEEDVLLLRWDISNLNAGTYELTVEVEDELGKTAVTDTRLLSVLTQWPDPPTPTPAPTPTATPPPTLVDNVRNELDWQGWAGGILTLLLGLLLLPTMLRRRNQRRAEAANDGEPKPFTQPAIVERQHTAVFEPVSDNTPLLLLTEENSIIGRLDPNNSHSLRDRSISSLHASVRWQNGRYWLYDEGSATGTFLNEERLGLRPLPLSEGDAIRLGRLHYRFALKPMGFSTEEE